MIYRVAYKHTIEVEQEYEVEAFSYADAQYKAQARWVMYPDPSKNYVRVTAKSFTIARDTDESTAPSISWRPTMEEVSNG